MNKSQKIKYRWLINIWKGINFVQNRRNSKQSKMVYYLLGKIKHWITYWGSNGGRAVKVFSYIAVENTVEITPCKVFLAWVLFPRIEIYLLLGTKQTVNYKLNTWVCMNLMWKANALRAHFTQDWNQNYFILVDSLGKGGKEPACLLLKLGGCVITFREMSS